MTEPGEKIKAPEVPFNNVLLKCLRSVDTTLGSNGNTPFTSADHGIAINTDGKNLITVTGNDVVIAGRSFEGKLVKSLSSSMTPDIDQRLNNFLNGVSGNLIRLNHVGVSYFCDDLQDEMQQIKGLATSSNVPLREEVSSEPNEKWLFLGDTSNWENPLVEIVLTRDSQADAAAWKPHFQIDIDTSLTLEQIRALTNQHLEKGFIKWQLDIPNHGTVLTMGILGQVGNTKISLGIGTNKRGTEHHRKNELKPLSDISSNQELPTIIPEEFYDKYRIVFSEYNLDRKIVRIGLNEEQRKAERLTANNGRASLATETRNSDGISREKYSVQEFRSIGSKIPQGNDFVN